MKALSIHPLFAGMIFCGKKTIEVRTWDTNYRGDIVICSTAKKVKGTIPSHALCVVRLADVIPFEKKHCKAAFCEYIPNAYAWVLEDLRIIRPVPVKGRLSLWNFDKEIEYLERPQTEEEDHQMFEEIWAPLFI